MGGRQAGSTPRGWDAGGDRERGGCGAHRAGSAGSGVLCRESRTRTRTRSTAGADGEPRGKSAHLSHRGAGRAREHKLPVPPGPPRAAAPVTARPPAPSASACAAAPPLSPELRPPRQLLKCRLRRGRPYRPPGRARPLWRGRLALSAPRRTRPTPRPKSR